MASNIDFVVAAGIFILFTAALISLLLNYMVNYFNIGTVPDLRTVAYDTFYSLFSNTGIPSNWENNSLPPAKLGLITNLYEVPFVVNDTSGTARANSTINVTINFDAACQNKAWNNTIKIYDANNNQVPFNLYNTSFCVSQYLKKADIVFNVTVAANANAKFFLFYSAQQHIFENLTAYAFPSASGYSVTTYPEMTLQAVSVDKLLALKNLSYDQISQLLSPDYKYYIEVGK